MFLTYGYTFPASEFPSGKFSKNYTGCPKKIVSRLFGCCGGAIKSIFSLFTQLDTSGFKVELETLYESI